MPVLREAKMTLMGILRWAAWWGRSQILGEHPEKKSDGGSDMLCPRQEPLKGELRVWASLPD